MNSEEAAGIARNTPLGTAFKVFYGAGSIADGVVVAGISFFLLFYLTAVCGLSGSLAGMASLVALLIDAVADPVIGLVSDRVCSRFGRRLPFMLFSIVPLACGFGLLFSVPASLSGVYLFAYVTACLIAVRLLLSFYFLPFTAVGAEVTDDYRERASVVSFRLSLQMLGTLLAVVLGLGVFMPGAQGILSRDAYIPYGWTCALLIAASGLVASAAVRKALPRLHVPAADGSPFLSGFVRELIDLVRNRSFLILSGTVMAFFLAYITASSLALHASRYFWGLDTTAIQFVLLGTTAGPLIAAPLSAFALRHVEKRTLAIGCFAAFSVLTLWPPLLRLYGDLHIDTASIAVMLTTNAVLAGAAMIGAGIAFQSMLADTADEHEWLFGVRREGLFFSGLTLAYKAAAGLGGLIAGFALDAIHFPADLASKGGAFQLPPEVQHDLGLIAGPLPAAFSLLAPIVLIGYRLSRERHRQIVAELAHRHAGRTRPS